MMYDSLFSRSFSKHEQKKLSYGAFVGCFLIVLSFCTVFKPYLGPLSILNLRLSIGNGLKMQRVNETTILQKLVGNDLKMHIVNETSTSQQILGSDLKMQKVNETTNPQQIDGNGLKMQKVIETSNPQPIIEEIVVKEIVINCNTNEPRSDYCELNGDVRVNGNSSTVSILSSQMGTNNSWKIKPYARKGDSGAMTSIREWSVISQNDTQKLPKCTKNHKIPAIIFSIGGYAGNHFHSFTDIIIPLFLTSRHFNGEVQFLITNQQSWWINKFRAILKGLSNYEVIDIDDTHQEIHCFPSIIVGLRNHNELSIDPSRSPHSMKGFRHFLRSVYSLKRSNAIRLTKGVQKRPRILIVSRKRSRVFTNTGKIGRMAKRVGFEVVVAEGDMNVAKFAEIVNSCDVLMGVHGAGLTNILFLPENAIFIQVIPFGAMKWLSETYFGEPSRGMNIKYLEYEITVKESSLMKEYDEDDVVIRDPYSISKKGWNAFKAIYMDKQNVMLDVKRFRATLVKAMDLLH